MAGERTSDGYLIRLKPHGIGRFFGAAFLTVWICGWAVGEAFALWLLSTGAMALMGVEMPAGPKVSLPAGPAVAMGAFLLFWLAIWTLGGVMAIREWLRLMWAEDRILVHGSGVRVTWCCGPFRRTKEYPRHTIRGVLLARHAALTLETEKERVELSPLGTLREREEAMTWLRSELAVGDGAGVSTDGAPVSLPKGWEESITAEGERALVPDRGTRRAQARFTGILTLVMAAAMLSLASGSLSSPSLIPGAILALCATLGLAWGTLWLVRGRMEWKIGSGRLTLRRRFAATLRDEFEADRLEVVVTRDSDGDEWFALEAVRGGEGAVNVVNPMEAARHARKHRRRITSALHDSTVPLRLGTWLSRAAAIPINDRTSAEARQFDIAVLKGQLDESGPVGKFALKLIEKVETKRSGKS
jgi:hypothetical protein